MEKTLSEVCSISSKLVDPREPEFIDLPHLGAGNMISMTGELVEIKTAREEGLKSGKFTFDETMVLYSKIRPYLMKACRPDFDGLCSADVYPLSPHMDQLDRNFLFHMLMSRHFTDYAISGSDRVGMPKVNRDHLFRYRFSLPDVSEQERIVAILDEAFKGIERAAANAEKNLANALELFESILNAIVLGDLHKKPKAVHDKGVWALVEEQRKRSGDKKFRNPKFVASPKAPGLPDDWIWASPEQLCTHIVDCLHSTPKWTQSGEVCLRTTNFRAGELDLSETRYVSSDTYSERISRLEPKSGDILYSREGGILGIACVHTEGLKACLGQRMMQFRLREELMLPEFFCAVLNSALVLGEVRYFTGGAAAPHLNIGDIRQFPIPVPPLAEQYEIVEIIVAQRGNHNRLRFAYQAKLQYLDDLRQSLLQKAFSGELTAQPNRAPKEAVA